MVGVSEFDCIEVFIVINVSIEKNPRLQNRSHPSSGCVGAGKAVIVNLIFLVMASRQCYPIAYLQSLSSFRSGFRALANLGGVLHPSEVA